uniref:Uncharacterized protein n=1 Tax=Anopheles merus TaxID=30066 RepID=A0A182V628_ANOME
MQPLPTSYSRLDAMKGFLARAAPPVEVEKRCFGDGNHISVQWLSIARPCGPADAIHPSIARDRSTLVAMSRAYHHCPYIRYHLSLVGQKIHTSCREHCCRKKKFNRSIDPAALENVVAPALGPVRRYNTVATPAAVHRSPMGSLSLSARKGMQPSEAASFRLRMTGSPSPASVRDHRDRPATAEAAAVPSSCNSDGIDV